MPVGWQSVNAFCERYLSSKKTETMFFLLFLIHPLQSSPWLIPGLTSGLMASNSPLEEILLPLRMNITKQLSVHPNAVSNSLDKSKYFKFLVTANFSNYSDLFHSLILSVLLGWMSHLCLRGKYCLIMGHRVLYFSISLPLLKCCWDHM
jgi:hypothetical protein